MMKKPFILLAVILLSLLLFSCELFMREPQPGKVYAILVALDYEGLGQTKLPGTIPDAKEQDKAFAALAGEKYDGYLFIQKGSDEPGTDTIGSTSITLYPTIKNIKDAISALRGVTTANDLILFTFSGHAKDGEIALAPEGGLKTIDTYEVAQLLDHFSSVKGRKLIILDACETGLAVPIDPASSSTLLENSIATWYRKYFNNNQSVKNDLFVMSSSANTESWEDTYGGNPHGVFTYALLKALGWDVAKNTLSTSIPPAATGGQLTVDGLLSYIKAHQSIPTKRSLFKPFGDFQHPMVSGGALDMILFTF